MIRKLIHFQKLTLFTLFAVTSLYSHETKFDFSMLVKNFKDLCQNKEGLEILSMSQDVLIESAIDQIVLLAQHERGVEFIKNIMKACCESDSVYKFKKKYLKKFTKKIDNHFIEICTAPHGVTILATLLLFNCDNRGDELHCMCLSHFITNLHELLRNDNFLQNKKMKNLLDELSYLDNDVYKKLHITAQESIQKILESDNNYNEQALALTARIFHKLLDFEKPESQMLYVKLFAKNNALFLLSSYDLGNCINDQKTKQYLFKNCVNDIVRSTTKEHIVEFIVDFTKKNADTIDFVIQEIHANFLEIAQSPFGHLLIKNFVTHDSFLIETLQILAIQNIATIHPQIIVLLNENSSDIFPLKKALKEYLKNHKTVDGLVKVWLYNSSCMGESEKIIYNSHSPTENHLKRFNPTNSESYIYYHSVGYLLHTFNKYQKDSFLQNMVIQVIEKEKELHDDYYTFVHGQRLHYLFFEQLHTFLYKELNNIKFNDFLYLHIKPIKHTQEDIKKEKQRRKNILKNGRKTKHDRKKLLFTNRAFFGNLTNLGSCSASYISDNSNVGNIDFTLKKVFSINNQEDLYARYKVELKALYKKFNALSSYGACIMIAIPKETARKQVYIASPGGYKKSIWLNDFGLSFRWTSDVNYLFDILENNPGKIDDIDQIEYCIPMTADPLGGLNPKSGIKIFPFIAANQEKLAEYYKEQQELFERIKKDIEGQMVVACA